MDKSVSKAKAVVTQRSKGGGSQAAGGTVSRGQGAGSKGVSFYPFVNLYVCSVPSTMYLY